MAEMSTKDYQRMKQLDSLTKNRKRKNPGDVQRESASKRTREKLKNIAKWKSKSPKSMQEKFKEWREKRQDRKIDPRYLLNKIVPAGGIAGGAKRLKDLMKKSGAGYSGSGDYKE